MTNDQLFERWWIQQYIGDDCLSPHVREIEHYARAAFHAALSDEDRETCIEALETEQYDAKERIERYAEVLTSREQRARHDLQRFSEARRRLEGQE